MRRWLPSLDVVCDGLHMGGVVWGLQSAWTGHWGISNTCQTLHRPFQKPYCSTEGSEQRKPESTLFPSPALVWCQKSSWKRIAKAGSSECDTCTMRSWGNLGSGTHSFCNLPALHTLPTCIRQELLHPCCCKYLCSSFPKGHCQKFTEQMFR